jgi:diacylglycerol kinase (ATP)
VKILLVFNPQARSGRAIKLLPAIRQSLARKNIEVELFLTEKKGHATEQLAQSSLQTYDGVVAAGGDGTLFEVLNGLYLNQAAAGVPLGIIPVGTGNAFARDLGLLPGDWQTAISIISSEVTRKVDVGRVTTSKEQFYFLNIIGMGFAVDAGLTAVRFKRLGNMAYTLGTMWQTIKLRHYPLQLEIDGLTIEQDNIFVEISNTKYTGTHFRIAPGAVMDDGRLDVTLLRRLPRLRLLRLFPSIYSGGHVNYDEITVLQGASIKIRAPEGYLLTVDGEFRGETPAQIDCLHQDLELFFPSAHSNNRTV